MQRPSRSVTLVACRTVNQTGRFSVFWLYESNQRARPGLAADGWRSLQLQIEIDY